MSSLISTTKRAEKDQDPSVQNEIHSVIGENDLNRNPFNEEFQISLYLTHSVQNSTSTEVDGNPQDEQSATYDKVADRMGETKKRRFILEMPTSQADEKLNLETPLPELTLQLRPSAAAGAKPMLMRPSEEFSPPSTQWSSTAGKPEELDDSGKSNIIPEEEPLPSLFAMGCSRCLMYVMVSEAEPQCPKCKSTILIDMFRGNKRSRND